MIGISVISPALPQYGRALGATPFLAGVLVGSLPAARVLLDLPAGALGDRFGNRRLMITGLSIIALTSAIAVHAFNYPVLLSVRFAEGVGSAFYVTSSLATLARRVPTERRGRYMGLYVNALLIGQVLGPVVGGFVTLAWGLRAPFAVYSLLACVGMVLITFGLEPEEESSALGRVDRVAVKRLLRDRSYLIVTSGTMAAFFIRAGLVSTVIPLFVVFNWGISGTLAVTYTGVLITTNALAQFITLYPSGLLADRIGRKVPFVLSLVGVGVVAPFLFLARDLASAIPMMFLFGAVIGIHGPLVAWTTDLTPKAIMGTSMGLYRTIGDLGFLLGPVILGFVLDITLVSGRVTIAPFLVAAAWAIVAGLTMLFARDPIAERRRAERAAGRAAPPGDAT